MTRQRPSYLSQDDHSTTGAQDAQKMAAMWKQCHEVARLGIARGFVDKATLSRAVSCFAHGSRQGLPLMEAHMLSLEAVRSAMREAI